MAIEDKIYSYFEANSKLRVLFIFDDRNIADELTDVVWRDGYRYVVFSGAWFLTKYKICHDWKEDKVVLLFPAQISPVGNREQMAKFPLLDILMANEEFKSTTWEQFIQQYGIPMLHADYVRRHVEELDQSRVKKVLQSYYSTDFTPDVANRGLLSVYLGQDHLIDWIEIIARVIIISNNDKKNTFYRKLDKNKDVYSCLDAKLMQMTGTKLSIIKAERLQDAIEVIKYNAITQGLNTETTDPYRSLKINESDRIHILCNVVDYAHNNSKLSEAFDEAIKTQASRIREDEIIRVYGYDADYHYISCEMCVPIINGIIKDLLPLDADGVQAKVTQLLARVGEKDIETKTILNYISSVAIFNNAIKAQTGVCATTPDDFVQHYTTTLYLTDMYYRQSLKAYGEINCHDTELDDLLKTTKTKVDEDYVLQCNVLNRRWIEALKKHEGFSQISSFYRQQDFYSKFVQPNSIKTVVIVVDALRYELAHELLQLMAKDHNTATMECGLAMVPTETKYCKSVLLPHSSLEYNCKGVVTNGQIVSGIDNRSRYLAGQIDDSEVVDFEKVYKFKDDEGKAYFKKNLVYIMHNAIDELCHPSTSAEDVTSTCQIAIEKIRTIVRKLHNSWNVKNVIITSDHGFIYNDIKIDSTNLYKVDDSVIDAEKGTRYYLTDSNKEIDEIVKLPIRTVSAFDNDFMVGIPYGTMRLTGHGGYKFAHGGASLQEVIIPIIVSSQVRETKVTKVGVNILERTLSAVSSMLKFNLIQTEPVNMDHRERIVVCGIYENDKLVSDEVEKVLSSSDNLPASWIQPVELKLSGNVSSNLLKLKILNKDKSGVDYYNPLLVTDVINNTLIERDEF